MTTKKEEEEKEFDLSGGGVTVIHFPKNEIHSFQAISEVSYLVVKEIADDNGQITIHILDTDLKLTAGCIKKVNCGKSVIFCPIEADWDDGRICQECLRLHRTDQNIFAKFTYAIPVLG